MKPLALSQSCSRQQIQPGCHQAAARLPWYNVGLMPQCPQLLQGCGEAYAQLLQKMYKTLYCQILSAKLEKQQRSIYRLLMVFWYRFWLLLMITIANVYIGTFCTRGCASTKLSQESIHISGYQDLMLSLPHVQTTLWKQRDNVE